MRKRPPPFGLVLPALVAAVALAVVLAERGSGHPHGSPRPPTIGIGATRACVTTGAAAQVTARSAIVVTASAQAPVTVTEQASGPNGIATVTRSEVVTARVRVDEPVEVSRGVAARRRACVDADSATAARTAALRRAYQAALAAAHGLATAQADRSLTAALHSRYPAAVAEARTRAAARAHELAQTAESSLAAQAMAEARRRAGA